MSDNTTEIEQDDMLAKIKNNIDKYGLHIASIKADELTPSFAYSIGLFHTYGHPEIICFGLNYETSGNVINAIAELIKNGETMNTYTTYDNIFSNCKAKFLDVDNQHMDYYFGMALNYYDGIKFPAMQLVWPDKKGNFPCEGNFDKEISHFQPILNKKNADFKFMEHPRLGVYTNRGRLLNKPILKVIHGIDGDWSFLIGEVDNTNPGDYEAILVGLGQIVAKDKTLNKVYYLDYGKEAEREFIGGDWTVRDVEYDEDENEDEEYDDEYYKKINNEE